MYKLYGQNRRKGWEVIKTSEDIEKLKLLAKELRPTEYFEYMIIEHTANGDRTIERKELFKNCKVEYSDNVRTKFEVKAITFKPSKMKEKKELRKITEEYLKN